jgi:hypothetical protein
VDVCPEDPTKPGYPMLPDEDEKACRPWNICDLGRIYYPFLIIAVIFIIIILFGLMKKRAILYQGKMAY